MTPDELVARGREPVPKPSPMEKLIDAQRVVGEGRMVRTDADPTKIPDDVARAICERARAYMKERGIRQQQVAKALGVSGPVLSAVLNGTYGAATAKGVVMDLDRWLENRQAADAQPKLTEFVWTTVAQEIRSVAKLAIRASLLGQDARIGLVYGDTGCGKTMALKAIAETEPGALYICCDYNSATPPGVLGKIARALRLDDGGPARTIANAIRSHLEGSHRLLIVDEIHALLVASDDKAFHTLRHLHDQTGAPQLWCSTPDLIGQLRQKEARGREPLGQIRSRIGIQRDLLTRTKPGGGGGTGDPLFTVDEIIAIYGRNEMKLTRDGGHYLASVANTPQAGGLRTVTSIVGAAVFTFKATHCELTAELLRSMHRTLDDRGYESVAARQQSVSARAVAKAG
jgi:DNA transposition AAA+ family ATPase